MTIFPTSFDLFRFGPPDDFVPLFVLLWLPKALRGDADLKTRASILGSVVVWPGDEGSIDEAAVRANYGLIKHVPAAYGLWNGVLAIEWGKWVMTALGECWQAGCSFAGLKD